MSAFMFEKLVAAGNDFLFIDLLSASGEPMLARKQRSRLATRLCDRHFGAGADGLVFIERAVGGGLKWDFYNSDGSDAEMCGNAARCMGLWAFRHLGHAATEFETLAGPMRVAKVGDMDYEVFFDHLALNAQVLEVALPGLRSGVLVNTGVPHAVFVVDDLRKAVANVTLNKNGQEFRAMRFPAPAGPRGANVTLLEITGEQLFASVTFERGVEDFTLACGTGVLAAAAVGLNRSAALEATVTTPGGVLRTRFSSDFSTGVLSGSAHYIFTAKLDEEWK